MSADAAGAIVVSGGSSGLGAATCKMLLQAGMSVAILDLERCEEAGRAVEAQFSAGRCVDGQV